MVILRSNPVFTRWAEVVSADKHCQQFPVSQKVNASIVDHTVNDEPCLAGHVSEIINGLELKTKALSGYEIAVSVKK